MRAARSRRTSPWRRAASFAVAAVVLGGCGERRTTEPPPPPDTQAPTTPGDVQATATSGTRIQVTWQRATDDMAVTGYRVSRDGTLLRAVRDTTTVDSLLQPSVRHCYTVAAYDSAGNVSPPSAPSCATPIHPPPTAALTVPAGALAGATLTVDASASRAAEGAIVSYAFDFGDGSAPTVQAAASVEHRYDSIGTFTVTVLVTDDLGGSSGAADTTTIGLVVGAAVNVSRTPWISQSAASSLEPGGAIDVAWEDHGTDLMFARSTDGGATFSTPTYVVDPHGYWGADNDFSSGQARVRAAGGTLHVAWTLFDTYYGGAEIVHVRSTDGGTAFTDPVVVSTVDSLNSYASSLAADGDGSVFIAWADANLAGTGGSGIRHARSTDDGATFSAPRTLVLSGEAVCPDVAGSSATIGIGWTQGPFGTEQILFARSTDGAQTFGAPLAVDGVADKSWCPHLAGDAAGTIYAAWEEGAVLDRRILFAASSDGGVTFGAPVTLSAPGHDATCPSLAAGAGGHVYVSWTLMASPGVAGESYLVASSDGGGTFGPSLRVPDATPNPACVGLLALAADRLGLTWHAPPDVASQPEIFFAVAQLSVP
jgi:hypothetical protein